MSGCNGQWLTCACDCTRTKCIRKDTFTNAIKELLERGHSKFRNVMICGPAKYFRPKHFYLTLSQVSTELFVILLRLVLRGLERKRQNVFS